MRPPDHDGLQRGIVNAAVLMFWAYFVGWITYRFLFG